MLAIVWKLRLEESPHLVANQLANLGRPGVGDGNDLDQLRILNVLGLGGLEASLKANAPVGAEPCQGLEGDDGTTPEDGPFLCANVLLVEVGRQVEGQEDGPDDGERPDVGVEVKRQRAQQFGLLYLGVVDEGRHRGRS